MLVNYLPEIEINFMNKNFYSIENIYRNILND